MKKGMVLVFALAALLFATKAYAASSESVWEMAKSDKYGKKAGGMLGRGLVNVATCFVDVIVQTVHGTQDGPPFVGTMTGLGAGIGCTALRVTSGALDVVTFWVPGFNGIPVSKSYENCLEVDEEAAPATTAQDGGTYVAPPLAEESAPAKHHNAMDYVKK